MLSLFFTWFRWYFPHHSPVMRSGGRMYVCVQWDNLIPFACKMDKCNYDFMTTFVLSKFTSSKSVLVDGKVVTHFKLILLDYYFSIKYQFSHCWHHCLPNILIDTFCLVFMVMSFNHSMKSAWLLKFDLKYSNMFLLWQEKVT